MKFKLTLEYDGSAFSGWQYQSEEILTVQGDILRALGILLKSYSNGSLEDHDFMLMGSGRTDKGVHAKAQVASFDWPEEFSFEIERFRYELNGITNRALSIKSISRQSPDFCARRAAHYKRYHYTVFNAKHPPVLLSQYSWWVNKSLNIEKILQAMELIRGTHDFSSFRAKDCAAKTTVRTLSKLELENRGDSTYVFVFEGNGFLKNMIRILIGTLIEVGKEYISVAEFGNILKAKDRNLAAQTAPANGLCLEYVKYQEQAR